MDADKNSAEIIPEQELPLVSILRKISDRYSFHMPANRAGMSFPAEFRKFLATADTTELPVTADINQPDGEYQRALDLAAGTFGAGKTYFITCGSTTSLRIALAAAFKKGDRILLPQGSHISIVYSFALLGLEPVFIRQHNLPRFPDGQPCEDDILQSLSEETDIAGIMLTTPAYYGQSVSLDKISRQSSERGLKLIVDAAHGAHFSVKFSDDDPITALWPKTALAQGADVVVQSAHKTLPALTPASYLHLSEKALEAGIISAENVEKMLAVFQTSSPSFPIAASMDYARYFVEKEAAFYVRRLLGYIEKFETRLDKSIKRDYKPGDDPCRLILDFSESASSRQEVAAILDEHKVDVELIDAMRLVCIPALDTPWSDFEALLAATESIAANKGNRDGGRELDREQRAAFQRHPEIALPLHDSLFIESETVELSKAVGRRSAGIIAPYPPGVPLIWPGDVINKQDVNLWQKLLNANFSIRGIKSNTVQIIPE